MSDNTKEVIFVKNQTDLVQEYLKQGNTLTTLEAMLNLGVGRLANHIWELRKKGLPIQSERVKQKNGKHHHVFWLPQDMA